jgi:hypothetical protein
MALIEREIGLAVLGTAIAASPKAREGARRAGVYALAGTLKAGEVVVATARGAAEGAVAGVRGQTQGFAAPTHDGHRGGNGAPDREPAEPRRAPRRRSEATA